jgi:hypothetical protein
MWRNVLVCARGPTRYSRIGKAVEVWPYIQWISTIYNTRVCRPSFLDQYMVDVESYCIFYVHWYDMLYSGFRQYTLDMVWMYSTCSLRMNVFNKLSFITNRKSQHDSVVAVQKSNIQKHRMATQAQQMLVPKLFLCKRYKFLQKMITWECTFIFNWKVLHICTALNYPSVTKTKH